MREMSCYDCFHCGACSDAGDPGFSCLKEDVSKCEHFINKADVAPVKHGEWKIETHSFYNDTEDGSIELTVYMLAKCSDCGQHHAPYQVFSKKLYAPEDADDGFRFDQEKEMEEVVKEFKQRGYIFLNYCPNCGAKMKGGTNE